jgi:hypothetical protein
MLSLDPLFSMFVTEKHNHAMHQARLLILHAPKLSEVVAYKGRDGFNRALRRFYTMFAAPRKVCWELPQGWSNALSCELSD